MRLEVLDDVSRGAWDGRLGGKEISFKVDSVLRLCWCFFGGGFVELENWCHGSQHRAHTAYADKVSNLINSGDIALSVALQIGCRACMLAHIL